MFNNICYHYTKEIDLIVPSLFVKTARPQCALWSRAANSFLARYAGGLSSVFTGIGQTLMSRPAVEISQDILPRKYGKQVKRQIKTLLFYHLSFLHALMKFKDMDKIKVAISETL
jgi:hypothetical protein